ncbi:hypothetical protein QL982_14425, partial [Psychrobacter sp. 5A.1]|uniref:hypothetical protein n=1 Tax=Psychrobacter sp. 5A.1 TaxID=3035207 RepID=UPI0025B5F960
MALSEQIITQPSSVTMQRFNSASVAHPTQSAEITTNTNTDENSADEDNQTSSQSLTLDTPAAFAPVTDTETIDEA